MVIAFIAQESGCWTGEDEIIVAKKREGLVGYEPLRQAPIRDRDVSVPKSPEDGGA